MQILVIIIIVVGIALIIAGNNVSRYLPPNFEEGEDDGFIRMLLSMGKIIMYAGIMFIVAGILFVLISAGN